MDRNLLSKLDQLPVSKWHWEMFFLLGFGLQFNGFLNSSGSSVLADLVQRGWSNNYYNAMFTSAMMIGFFIGSLAGGWLGDKAGRKRAYQASVLMFAVFALVAAASPNILFLVVCRALMGIGMGSGIVLGYGTFTEFMPARVRGKWSARISFLGNLSPLIAMGLGYLLIPRFGWRMMFVVGGVLSLIVLIFISLFLDESPRWFLKNGRLGEGEAVLNKIVASVEAERGEKLTFKPVATTVPPHCDEMAKPLRFREFFKGSLGRRTLVSSVTLIAMNLSLYTITTWIPTIFVNQGINISKSLLMSMLIMIGAPLGVFASTLIIDKYPRKWFGVVMIVAIAILGYVYANQRTEIGIVVIGVLLIFILYIYNSFSSAVYAPEVWPTKEKMRGLGIADAVGRLFSIVTPYLIAWLLTNFGVRAVFIVVGAMLVLCAVLLALFGFETRNKTCEEIDNLLKRSSDKKSSDFDEGEGIYYG